MSGASKLQILLEREDERKPVVWLLDATGALKPLAVQTIKSGWGSSQIKCSDLEKWKINIEGRKKPGTLSTRTPIFWTPNVPSGVPDRICCYQKWVADGLTELCKNSAHTDTHMSLIVRLWASPFLWVKELTNVIAAYQVAPLGNWVAGERNDCLCSSCWRVWAW